MLVATTQRGLAFLDVTDPSAPSQIAFLWLRQTGHDWEAAVDDGSGPPWPGLSGGDAHRPAVGVGYSAVMAAGGDLLVIDVSEPASPQLAGWVPLDEPARSLRAAGQLVYSAGPPGHDEGAVYDVGSVEDPAWVGDHDVVEWVRGALVNDGWAFRARPSGLEVAWVER